MMVQASRTSHILPQHSTAIPTHNLHLEDLSQSPLVPPPPPGHPFLDTRLTTPPVVIPLSSAPPGRPQPVTPGTPPPPPGHPSLDTRLTTPPVVIPLSSAPPRRPQPFIPARPPPPPLSRDASLDTYLTTPPVVVRLSSASVHFSGRARWVAHTDFPVPLFVRSSNIAGIVEIAGRRQKRR
jgi:hypothetical protein